MGTAVCSIFFHNYYGQHEDWIRLLCETIHTPSILYYNIVTDSLYNLENDGCLMGRLQHAISGSYLKKLVIRRSPNQGKDIGGKFVLLDAALCDPKESDYGIFLHDKKSPYAVQGREWKEKLFRIIEPSFAQKALALFDRDQKIGVIANSSSIYNEYNEDSRSFTSNNGPQLEQLLSELAIRTTDFRYVAGTMFWARLSPLWHFFRAHPPLDIRKTLEKGNIMDETTGTNTHAWERLLIWLIFAQGYTIKGI